MICPFFLSIWTVELISHGVERPERTNYASCPSRALGASLALCWAQLPIRSMALMFSQPPRRFSTLAFIRTPAAAIPARSHDRRTTAFVFGQERRQLRNVAAERLFGRIMPRVCTQMGSSHCRAESVGHTKSLTISPCRHVQVLVYY